MKVIYVPFKCQVRREAIIDSRVCDMLLAVWPRCTLQQQSHITEQQRLNDDCKGKVKTTSSFHAFDHWLVSICLHHITLYYTSRQGDPVILTGNILRAVIGGPCHSRGFSKDTWTNREKRRGKGTYWNISLPNHIQTVAKHGETSENSTTWHFTRQNKRPVFGDRCIGDYARVCRGERLSFRHLPK